MYEGNFKVDPKGIYQGKSASKACEEHELELGWTGFHWNLCNVIEIDVVKSFASEDILYIVGTDQRQHDLGEFQRIGKSSFDSLIKICQRKIENNADFELLCTAVSWMIAILFKVGTDEKAIVIQTEDGEEFRPAKATSFLNEAPFRQLVPALAKQYWPHIDEGGKGVFEAFANCQVIRMVDSAVIQHCLGDTRAMTEAADELYAYKNFLDWMELVAETNKVRASKAAKARHAETEWIKSQVYEYYDQHRHRFKSLREAALEIERIEPVKFRTIYDWLRKRAV